MVKGSRLRVSVAMFMLQGLCFKVYGSWFGVNF